MPTHYEYTRNSGTLFEDQVTGIIKRYTNACWRNVRVETLLTKKGNTEMDILFCYQNLVFIVEAKNVSSILGEYSSKTWGFVGSRSGSKETRDYTSLNVITQNNIHARSFKDFYYSHYQEWITVVPIITVPNFCQVSEEIASVIYTLAQFDNLLYCMRDWDVPRRVQRKVAALIHQDGEYLRRPDFITVDGERMKQEILTPLPIER